MGNSQRLRTRQKRATGRKIASTAARADCKFSFTGENLRLRFPQGLIGMNNGSRGMKKNKSIGETPGGRFEFILFPIFPFPVSIYSCKVSDPWDGIC